MNMTPRGGMSAARLLMSLSTLALLTGCVVALESRHQGPSSLIKGKVERFYRQHAVEQRGRCTRPFIDAITKVDVIDEDTPDRWVANIRYRYMDRLRDEDPGSDRKICRGFASRTFTLASQGTSTSGDDEPVVIDMSGTACRAGRFSLNNALGLEKGHRTCP